MTLIVGASSLHATVKSAPATIQRRIYRHQTSIPGLSLNPNTRKHYKLNRKLKSVKGLILWHDLINNTISPHRSNGYKPCSTRELLNILTPNKNKISAIVYCRRFGTPDIFEELRKLDILVIRVKQLLSTRKRKNTKILGELLKVHPSVRLELQLLKTIFKNRNNLRKLVLKKRSQSQKRKSKKRSSSKRRQTKLNKEKTG